jgi:hypothetical protein
MRYIIDYTDVRVPFRGLLTEWRELAAYASALERLRREVPDPDDPIWKIPFVAASGSAVIIDQILLARSRRSENA